MQRYVTDGYIAYRCNLQQYYSNCGACDSSLFPAYFIAREFVTWGSLFVGGSAEFAVYLCVSNFRARVLPERLIVPIWRNQITLLLVSRPLSYQLLRYRG